MMSASTEEIIFMLLEHFDHDSTLMETAHTLGRESGLFFGVRYFENMVLQGRWQDVENYLSGFTKVMDNDYSRKIYFELRKQKYIEALDRNDRKMGLEILMKELKVFALGNEELFTDLVQLLTLKNIREYRTLTTYTDAYSARKILVNQLKPFINQHPQLQGKLNLPATINHTLRHVIDRCGLKQAPTNRVEQLLSKRVEFSNTSEKKILFVRLTTLLKNKIVRLTYTNAGNAILALTSNGTHFHWRWPELFTLREVWPISPRFLSCPTTRHGLEPMRNCLTSANSGDLVSCFDISNRDLYLISLSGGAVSLYNLLTFKTMETLMPPPPMATCVAFYPEVYHIVFVGMDDSSIVLYYRGNGQWNQEGLVVITHATFSSNGSWVFASFVDGILAVFHSSNFYMQYKIHPSAYFSSTPSVDIYPTCIAADPINPDMFAVGLTDGDVYVIEPPLDTKW